MQLFEALNDDRYLNDQHCRRDQVADKEPGASLICVGSIKRVIQSRELGHDEHYNSGNAQIIDYLKSLESLVIIRIFIKIYEIGIKSIQDSDIQEKDRKITYPDDPVTGLGRIASVSVRKAVGDHDEHRADLYCQKGYTPLLREGSHQQNKDGNNAAHCTQDHHDVFLMRLQKSDQSICQTKCLL